MSAKERLLERLNPRVILSEVVDTLIERAIPQGAAELAQALNTGVSFVPYGPGQQPAEVDAAMDTPLQGFAVTGSALETVAESSPVAADQSTAVPIELTDPLQRAAANALAAESRGKSRDLEMG